MKVLKVIGIIALILLVVLALVFLAARLYFSYRTSRRPEFGRFAQSPAPTELPNGSYIGHAGSQGNWLGKSFDAQASTGINRFSNGERYRFHMYLGHSLTNRSQPVLVIDYNEAGNPWWLRLVVDEVVSTGPGQLLGKIQINVVPRLPFTVGYFTLQK